MCVYADFFVTMNTQPSAEEQVTVNIMFIEVDQSLFTMETKQKPVLCKVLQYT